MNEATLTARIDQVLSTVFPTFRQVQIHHQQSFSFHLGHHAVEVDHSDPSKYPQRAILDILLSVEGKNIILLELKREGHPINDDDVDQGISYARLVHPMPPVTLISNGSDNRFYNSYTKEPLPATTIDLQYLQDLTDNSFKLATNDFKHAVQLLLNNDPVLFASIINSISDGRFADMTGTLTDLHRPIACDFQIQRTILNQIEPLFDQETQIVGIRAQAFSGKTNLLYQFFQKQKREGNYALYVNCTDQSYSILQQLANSFTKETKVSTTTDKVREWIINSLDHSSSVKFYLLLDNFNPDMDNDVKTSAIELIDIFQDQNRVIYTADEYNFRAINFIEDRTYKTIIGENSKTIALDELNDHEFESLNTNLTSIHGICLGHGAGYANDYRHLRILRYLLAAFKPYARPNSLMEIISVPNLEILKNIAGNSIYTDTIRDLYRKLVHCFIEEKKRNSTDVNFNIAAHGKGAILLDTFQELFPNDRDLSLEKRDTVILRRLPNGRQMVIPKFSELIAFYCIEAIATKITQLTNNVREAFQHLIQLSSSAPFSDIVGAGVLMKIAREQKVDFFSGLVQRLLESPPVIETIDSDTTILLKVNDTNQMEHVVSEGTVISPGSYLPFVILSQLGWHPLATYNDGNTAPTHSDYRFHLMLLRTVGSYNDILRWSDPADLNKILPYTGHDIGDMGFIVSGPIGIIEPIVHALRACFREIPTDMDRFIDQAFTEKNFFLLWRMHLGLRDLCTSADTVESLRARAFNDRFIIFFNQFMAEQVTSGIEDPEMREGLRRELLKFHLGHTG